MEKMNKIEKERIDKYNELFPNDEAKARAFEKLAEEYYLGNFGTMQKSNLDVLMFSIYLNRILDKTEEDIYSYSSYNLSKWLGITQSRVNSLKEKKQLMYPREYEWEEAFFRVCKHADYKDGMIYINLSDRNLFNEIKNAIEEDGGYVEVTLTQNLLKVSAKYYLPLLVRTSSEENQAILFDLLKKEDDVLKKFIEEKYENKIVSEYAWKDVLLDITQAAAEEILLKFVPVGGKTITSAVNHIRKKIEIDRKRREAK